MSSEMSQRKATAEAHMQRDIDAVGKWVCDCEACQGIRSLAGVQKMLAVRPLLRELLNTGEMLDHVPEGEEKQGLVELYHNLHDKLAEEMSK
jgi:hypothetical protein